METNNQSMFEYLSKLEEESKIAEINRIKLELQKYSPFAGEPVDCVIWVKSDDVESNDYNPNTVAPPEMKLLEVSIKTDGYTQPIVTFNKEDKYEVVDGFHRSRVGKESDEVRERVKGYLPIVVINEDSEDRGNRIAATIRHNRARGKHLIDGMAEIILELKRRNWSDEKISKNLGMDSDEVLRLSQITGIADMFKDQDFSKAWDVDSIDYDDTLEITTENEESIPSL